jgi:DNA-directed RNA polymerase subunit RPC12/RpoP
MTKVPITVMGYRCTRCGHEWVPREGGQEPRVCPKCKSPYWNVPRQSERSPGAREIVRESRKRVKEMQRDE